MGKKEEITFEIIENLGVLSVSKAGWTTEVNLVSWNGGEPVLDIRAWSPDKEKKGKGITLKNNEAIALLHILGIHLEIMQEEECADNILQ